MTDVSKQTKILAFAVYELRQLLSGQLGSASEGDLSVRTAAHLAYALHNQAGLAMQGEAFDVQGAITALAAVDRMLGESYVQRLSKIIGNDV